MMKEKYFTIKEETNALDYLEQTYVFIQKTQNSNFAWKWVAISLFGAMYGFMICALKGTNPNRVTHSTERGPRLINFDEALKRCKKQKYMEMTIHSKTLQLSKEQMVAIKRMKNLLRNNFEHYIPKVWAIEMHFLPQMTLHVLDVIRFLALETGNYTFLKPSQIRKLKSYIYQSKRILKQSKLYKEHLSLAQN